MDWMLQNYPNPFNSKTVIRFHNRSENMRIRIQIFDCLGKEVRRLSDRPYGAGIHEVIWDRKEDHGKEVSGGVYFCRISTEGGLKKTVKMALVK